MDPILKFTVNNQRIYREDNFHVVAGSKNYLKASFEFKTPEWDGKTKTAVFHADKPYPVVLVNDACEVPWEFTAEPGNKYVSVFAGDLITANKAMVEVWESGYKEGETPKPPTPTVYEQMIQAFEETKEYTAEQADLSKRYAVGSPEYPGSETDNAEYYYEQSAENARKTDSNREQAENLVVQIGGVLKSAEQYSEQAAMSASNAHASEEAARVAKDNAEADRAAAEVAEDQARLYAEQTGENKEEVMLKAEQVSSDAKKAAEDRKAAEQAVLNATAAGEKAVLDVTSSGKKAVEDIAFEKNSALDEIDLKGDAQVANIQTAGKAQIDAIKEAGGGVENALSNYFALRRNGKVFTTKIYKYATSTSPAGVKMNANENMVCEPSVGRTEGRDDYAQYGLFQHFTCNFSVDENGFNHVDALEGQTGFTKYGKVQVGEVTMSAWFGIEDTADAVLYHYSDRQTELTPHPMKESVNPDGTLSPFMIHAKYAAGDIEGAPYSSKGLAPANGCQAAEAKNPVSYTGMITYMHKLGGHYCGTTSWDLFYRQLMMIIKYATTHSQSVMAGCTSYSLQNMNLVEETGVSRVIVTTAQAANYVVGSYVSIGDMGESTSKDRNSAYMHNLAYSVKILSIEAVDDTNSAIYVDAPEAFDTTLTTCISTMPWHSGSTDEVAGSDGSLGSNTSGKYAYKIQGIETCIGAYEVLGNVVIDNVTQDENVVKNVYVCENASDLSSNITTIRESYKKAKAQVYTTNGYISTEITDVDLGIMIPTEIGAGSNTGFADYLYTDKSVGQREWLALGRLHYGGNAGLWFLHASHGWSNANWCIVSGVSPNGTRGEWQAAA